MEYKIQLTQKGDYIVRNSAGREYARLATQAEAEAWITKKNQEETSEMATRESKALEQASFDESTSDLNNLQIRWQNWRSWFYDNLVHEDRRIGQFRRHLDNIDSNLPSYSHHESNLTEDQKEQQEAHALYYGAVEVDTKIKAARRGKNSAELERLLIEEAEPIIEKMSHHFLHMARPEEYKKPHKPGTKPDTSLFLGEERKIWLQEQGGIQPTIQRLIDESMKS